MTGHSSNSRVVAALSNLSLTFNRSGEPQKKVLNDVSLELREGEFVVLVGRSGCGKTTILNALAGLQQITSGKVSVFGSAPAEARSKIGYMFARDALLPWRSALRNVELGLEIAGARRPERRIRARQELELVGLAGEGHLHPWRLSQGMRQRVALARTWARDPQLVLMDEPFAALDAQTRESVQNAFLKTWLEHRRTVVLVTHDLSEAVMMADRICVMANGRIEDEFEVPLDRPRDISLPQQAEVFARLRQRMLAVINADGRQTENLTGVALP